MAFVNERFPADISYDAIEMVRHSTSVVRVNSGARSANKNWAFPLREFDVSHVLRFKNYADSLVAFNLTVAEGMANSFRLKAWADYKAAAGVGIATLISGDNYQMYKRYTFGAFTKDRKITLPVSGTIAITGGGTYSIDYITGIITRSAGAAPTGWSGEYDVKACFSSDLASYVIRASAGGDFMIANEQVTLYETP